MDPEDVSQIERAEFDMTVDTIAATGQLLNNPRWAKIWFSMDVMESIVSEEADNPYLSRGITAQEVIEDTGIPQTTVYQDLDDMVDAGCISITNEGKPKEYWTSSVHFFVSNHPGNIGEEYYVEPSLIGVIGEAYEDEDVELFLERNSYTVLNLLISEAMGMLSDEGVDASLANYVSDLDPVDAALIEPAIRRVLKEVSTQPLVDWEYPEE